MLPRERKDRIEAAKNAGLTYSTDETPGIRRVAVRGGFRYLDPRGRAVRDGVTLDRIGSLVIPPNWSHVWICPRASGHLQVTARDAKGRKQYRYHPDYRAHRDGTKFDNLVAFARVLPAIRRRIERDLALPGLPRERVLAAVVRLLDCACIRIGNIEYARQGDSYGLTTMQDRHVRVSGGKVKFRFKGKSGRLHDLELDDRRLASVVKRSRDLPGYQLFQYVDGEGETRTVDSTMVNDYLRDIAGGDVSSKDFRTWHGTVRAAIELRSIGGFGSQTELRRNLAAAVRCVADHLGNRPATCRKYYIHPAILDAYSSGSLEQALTSGPRPASQRGLTTEEASVIGFLRKRGGVRNAKKIVKQGAERRIS